MRVSLEQLSRAVREREPDPAYADVPDPVLVESFTREAAQLAASTCRWLLMLAEIVRRGVWAQHGMVSPAAWLSWRAGMAASTAREHVRVALALADFPVATGRFAAGELSYSKVRAIVSTGRPELDELLVEFAKCASGQQLQRICRSFVTADGPTVDPWAARDANLRELPGGMSEIRIVGPTAEVEVAWNTLCRRADELHVEEYQALKAAAAASDDAAAADEPGGSGDAVAAAPARPEPIGARRADAAFEAFAGLDGHLGEDTMGRDRHLVVLHTHEAALTEPVAGQDRLIPVAADSGRAPTLSVRVLRRLRSHTPRHRLSSSRPPTRPVSESWSAFACQRKGCAGGRSGSARNSTMPVSSRRSHQTSSGSVRLRPTCANRGCVRAAGWLSPTPTPHGCFV